MNSPVTPATKPLVGMYAFVKDHIVIVNAIVAASTTIVGVLDFLAPRLSIFPVLVYSLLIFLLALMLLAPVKENWARGIIRLFGFGQMPEDGPPLWRQPVWQFLVSLLVGVSVLGFTSVAKASEGGIMASQFPFVKGLQDNLQAIKHDTEEIKDRLGEIERSTPSPLCGEHFNVTKAAEALRNGDAAAADKVLKQSRLPAAVRQYSYDMAECAFLSPVSDDLRKTCSGKLWVATPEKDEQLFLLSYAANCGFYVYSKAGPEERETLVALVRRAAEIAKDL